MALTDAQLAKLDRTRKENPPSYFRASTQSNSTIIGEIEDAIILSPVGARQQAAAYFDQLAATNPETDDADAITARAATRQQSNIDAALTELDPVIDRFETFRYELTGADSTDSFFAIGMQPLLQSVNGGIAATRLRIESLRFLRKFSIFAAAKYGGAVTDNKRKEWRSWKRVLVSYP